MSYYFICGHIYLFIYTLWILALSVLHRLHLFWLQHIYIYTHLILSSFYILLFCTPPTPPWSLALYLPLFLLHVGSWGGPSWPQWSLPTAQAFNRKPPSNLQALHTSFHHCINRETHFADGVVLSSELWPQIIEKCKQTTPDSFLWRFFF